MLPPTYLFSAIAVMAVLHFLFPLAKIVPPPWNLLGAVPLVFGIILNLLADRAFKKRETTVKPFEESTALITSGVFRISRHPMYLGMLLILAGIGILMRSLSPFLVIPVFGILMERVFITVEEGMLERQFGGAWLQYRDKVGRWI